MCVDTESPNTVTVNSSGYVKFTDWGNGCNPSAAPSGVTTSAANDNLTLPKGGVYKCWFDMHFNGSASITYHLALFKTGVKIPASSSERTLGTANQTGSTFSQDYVDVTAGDTIDLRVIPSGSGNKNFTVDHGSMGCERLE